MTYPSLVTLLEESVRAAPRKPATVCRDSTLTYAELHGLANRLANSLTTLGVEPGDRVAVMLPNGPDFIAAYYATLRLGGIVVPINTLLREIEVAHQLHDSEAKVLIVWEDVAEEAMHAFARAPACRYCLVTGERIPEGAHSLQGLTSGALPSFEPRHREGDDTAVILYTAGTTGQPKGAELTHDNLSSNVLAAITLMGLRPDDVVMAALPLHHSFGQTCCMNAALAAGATLSCMAEFSASEMIERFAREQVTIFAGVPTMYYYLTQHVGEAKPTHSLRLCITGGAPMPVWIMHEFEKRFGVTVLEGYGLSETSPVASFNVRGQPRKVGSIGVPIPGVQMRIVDEMGQELPPGEIGEIVIRGPNVMKGYHRRPAETAQVIRHGWFHTGDLAYMDEDGYFFIVGRKTNMIIKGGFNVYPREVEIALESHPAVLDVAVVGVPDEALGEEVKAYVVLHEGQQLKADELIAYCRERIAAYKCPGIIEFRDHLPKGSAGELLKRELKN